ncbi:hypothetical protein SCALIN_C04_0147 [Candidatus Scalindua japonica]|uniref:Glycosyltransferase n=1 Tax=Candidatus Scalindua japonica TaxID=1284222 RepID=A0A286TUU8_9BACT|nr:flagellar brake protein [Candidatus Scalindua japonica]GAX59659.1 hypothetical protein SCALIN_C04_0147 [Candidatus Scalindua japonica]
MNIGTIFRLQIIEVKRQLSSELIGIDDGKYLIVKMPPLHTMDNVSNLLVTGNEIAVKYMYKGKIFGFESTILDLIHKPFRLVFIKYPEKIDSFDFRGNKRVECFLPAHIKIAEYVITGSITDISRAGCLFALEIHDNKASVNLFELNNEVSVAFHLPGIEEELGIEAKQRSVKKHTDHTSIGIEFLQIDSSVQTKLFEFLSKAEA